MERDPGAFDLTPVGLREDYPTDTPDTSPWPEDNASAAVTDPLDVMESDGGIPTWMDVLDMCQLTCTIIGFMANVLTLLTLVRHPGGFSRVILILLRHQSLVDSWVCLMASIVILQPFMWLTGDPIIDSVVCYAWHGQALYWGAVTLSTYNLMLIAFERYLAVCWPFTHCKLSKVPAKKLGVCFAGLYLLTLVITHGTYIQTKLENGHCLLEYAFDGDAVEAYFFAFVIFTYLATYFIPVVFMATLYALIIRKLRMRSKRSDLGHSKVVGKASAELTKTAIAVTVVFTLSIGYDLHYYLLGYTGVTEYKLNTAIQKIGVFMSNLNSCANPFVYALFMPMYRRSVIGTIRCSKLDLDRSHNTSHASHDDHRDQGTVVTLASVHINESPL